MSLLIAEPSIAATAEYCRRARKIRASFCRNAFLRHEALTSLARQREEDLAALRALTGFVDSPQKPVRVAIRHRVVPNANSPVEQTEREFAEAIAAKLQPFGFTFSDRLRLLNQAERMGINRFRANVMLAMHEHQAGRSVTPVVAKARPMPSLWAILAAESAVVLALVWFFAS